MSEKADKEKEILLKFVDQQIEHAFKNAETNQKERDIFNRCVLIPQIERNAKLNKKLKDAEKKGKSC